MGLTIYDYLFIYFVLGFVMYVLDEFDAETDIPEFNFRDAITFTLLGGAIKLKAILVAMKGAVTGGTQKLGLLTYIKAVFNRHFKSGRRG